jgi:uncharacterized membrane protein YbhN (UPF0104 family)
MQSLDPPASPEPPCRRTRAKGARVLLMMRVLVSSGALVTLLWVVPLHQVLASVRLIRASALCEAMGLIFIATALATLRWRLLFTTCGLPAKPRFLKLLRAYWIGTFYNSYMPGGFGGDVLRGVATRRVVGPGGLPTALAIVLLERTLGFIGMLLLVATTLTLFPLQGMPNITLFGSVGILLASLVVIAIASGPRVARYLPAPVARVAGSLPTIVSLPSFLAALALSVLTQLCGVGVGHLLIASITARVAWSDSLTILPLVNASQYFPLTFGGAGMREASFVALYGMIGIARADALATSMTLTALQYALSGLGGILHALRPLDLD